MCEEKTEAWEKEELKVCLSSRVPGLPGLALASGSGLGAARLPLVSAAGSWHRVATMQGREKRVVRSHPHPSSTEGAETEVLEGMPNSLQSTKQHWRDGLREGKG